MGETRQRLLRILRRAPATITALAAELGLTDNGVRNHVAALERDGLVAEGGLERDTGGKPARVYRLTSAGEESFPKAYALVLKRLVDEISRLEGSTRAATLLSSIGEQAARAARPATGEVRERVEAAAAALRSLGGDVEVEPVAEGWKLKGNGCPLSYVTRDHPEACALARSLVATITELPVTEVCDRADRPRCAFIVDRPLGS
jgi:predicted ArsR family transcriptional regulator